MTDQNQAHNRLHQAMHQLPGFPDHDRAAELNGNQAGRTRAARTNEAGRARAKRWNANSNTNAAAARRHSQPPRVLPGVQGFIARVLGQGE